MQINRIDRDISVAPQLSAADVPAIAEAGFKTIICNRPDGEGNDQPLFHGVGEAAAKAGIGSHYLPVKSGRVTDSDAEEFGRILDAAPKPVLAYCRSGTRSVTLWSLSQAGKMGLPDILHKAKAAGYNMHGMARRIANNGRKPNPVASAGGQVMVARDRSRL